MKNLFTSNKWDTYAQTATLINSMNKVRGLLAFILVMTCFMLVKAQTYNPIVELKLEFDEVSEVYSVYFMSEEDTEPGYLGSSQISIVIPSYLDVADFSVVQSYLPANRSWILTSYAESPEADDAHHFLGLLNLGGLLDVQPDVWQHLFDFSIAGDCARGVRLFENELDPDSAQPGMHGGDYKHSIVFQSPSGPEECYNKNAYASNRIVYVDQNASGNGSGDSWGNAYQEFSAALANLTCGTSEIWIASGTYKPTNNLNRNIAFNIPSGIKVYGGFIGNEASTSERPSNPNPTILSGNIGNSSSSDDNSHNVVRVRNNHLPVLIDGVTIEDGNADHQSNTVYSRGGGINVANSSLYLNQVIVRNNLTSNSGGAIYSSHTDLVCNGTVLINNQADLHGGGIQILRSTLNANNLSIKQNTALANGGGMYASMTEINALNMAVDNNDAHHGGGLYLFQTNADLVQSLIVDNEVDLTASAVYLAKFTNLSLLNSTVANNYSDAAEHAFRLLRASELNMMNSIVWGNDASITAVKNSSVDLQDCDIEGGYGGGTNVVDFNPEFMSVDDYRLSSQSPLLDLGEIQHWPSEIQTDLTGSNRVEGATIDFGPYEYSIPSSPLRYENADKDVASVFKVYPNPVVDQFTIKSNLDDFDVWRLVNQSGQIVKEGQIQSDNQLIHVADLPSGHYVIVAFGSEHNESTKLIKIK